MSRRPAHLLLFDLNLFLGLTAVAGGIALLVGWINVPLSAPWQAVHSATTRCRRYS
jgi:hypothetical protein